MTNSPIDPTDPNQSTNSDSNNTEETLSAWMDGELPPEATRFLLRRLQHNSELPEHLERWQWYGDVLRQHDTTPPMEGFSQRVMAAIGDPVAPAVTTSPSLFDLLLEDSLTPTAPIKPLEIQDHTGSIPIVFESEPKPSRRFSLWQTGGIAVAMGMIGIMVGYRVAVPPVSHPTTESHAQVIDHSESHPNGTEILPTLPNSFEGQNGTIPFSNAYTTTTTTVQKPFSPPATKSRAQVNKTLTTHYPDVPSPYPVIAKPWPRSGNTEIDNSRFSVSYPQLSSPNNGSHSLQSPYNKRFYPFNPNIEKDSSQVTTVTSH